MFIEIPVPDKISRLSDASLLRRFRAGDDDAASALCSRYSSRLVELAKQSAGSDLLIRVDAEDIVQSAFGAFFHRVSIGHYLVEEGEELWKLLLVIVLNKVRMAGKHHRAAKRNIARTRSIFGDFSSAAEPATVLRMTIDDLLQPLPDSYQRIVHARIQGFQITEIADQVAIPCRTVERVLHSFRRQLRTTLEN